MIVVCSLKSKRFFLENIYLFNFYKNLLEYYCVIFKNNKFKNTFALYKNKKKLLICKKFNFFTKIINSVGVRYSNSTFFKKKISKLDLLIKNKFLKKIDKYNNTYGYSGKFLYRFFLNIVLSGFRNYIYFSISKKHNKIISLAYRSFRLWGINIIKLISSIRKSLIKKIYNKKYIKFALNYNIVGYLKNFRLSMYFKHNRLNALKIDSIQSKKRRFNLFNVKFRKFFRISKFRINRFMRRKHRRYLTLKNKINKFFKFFKKSIFNMVSFFNISKFNEFVSLVGIRLFNVLKKYSLRKKIIYKIYVTLYRESILVSLMLVRINKLIWQINIPLLKKKKINVRLLILRTVKIFFYFLNFLARKRKKFKRLDNVPVKYILILQKSLKNHKISFFLKILFRKIRKLLKYSKRLVFFRAKHSKYQKLFKKKTSFFKKILKIRKYCNNKHNKFFKKYIYRQRFYKNNNFNKKKMRIKYINKIKLQYVSKVHKT